MAFGVFTEEQQGFREVVRDFFASKSSEQEVRRLMASDEGVNREVWRQFAGELGAVGIAIPEEYGGQGFTWVEFGIVLEEAGRALFTGPLFSTAVLGATALLESGDESAKQIRPQLCRDRPLLHHRDGYGEGRGAGCSRRRRYSLHLADLLQSHA
jgi:alkylation response protein AidB-like acyl-CoA dehydrogenase